MRAMQKRILFALMLLLCWSLACARDASPGDACPGLRGQLASADQATRIAAIACNEHLLWFRPFIDVDGRLASATVSEAEASRLADGASEPWRRVAGYWRDSGLLWRMNSFPGAGECARAGSGAYPSPSCRAFVVDRPWSAAFISYVMTRAGLPGFQASASHYDYVAAAFADPAQSAFQFLDPASAKPATGDLLCYVRNNGEALGHAGFAAALGTGGGPYNMHCDIVVSAHAGKAWLVGGNVQQGVTMRVLPLNRNGNFWSLPQRTGAEGGCSPDNPAACSFNRQDWVALLKLKPAEALARLRRATPVVPILAPAQQPRQCCTACVVGSGVPRCPKPLVN
jgi:hypothetical protein